MSERPDPAPASQSEGINVAGSALACNLGAFDEAERARHSELTRELQGAVLSTSERQDGYELRISAEKMPLTHLAEWVSLESRCCPFLDFRIAQPRNGGQLLLELTGEPGVKPILRASLGN